MKKRVARRNLAKVIRLFHRLWKTLSFANLLKAENYIPPTIGRYALSSTVV